MFGVTINDAFVISLLCGRGRAESEQGRDREGGWLRTERRLNLEFTSWTCLSVLVLSS